MTLEPGKGSYPVCYRNRQGARNHSGKQWPRVHLEGARPLGNENDVTLDFSRPGKPTDNAFVESFDGRLRDECLNAHWFLSLADTRTKIEAWRKDCNESRPHTSLG